MGLPLLPSLPAKHLWTLKCIRHNLIKRRQSNSLNTVRRTKAQREEAEIHHKGGNHVTANTICVPLVTRCKQESSSRVCMNTSHKNWKEKRHLSWLKLISITRSGMVLNVQRSNMMVERLKWAKNTRACRVGALSCISAKTKKWRKGGYLFTSFWFLSFLLFFL